MQSERPERTSVFEPEPRLLPETIQKLAALQGNIDEQRWTLIGVEGVAGRVYFECIAKLMPSEYQFIGRSRRPAVDPFNSMLNYAYGVLYSQVERSLILERFAFLIGINEVADVMRSGARSSRGCWWATDLACANL